MRKVFTMARGNSEIQPYVSFKHKSLTISKWEKCTNIKYISQSL